MDQSARDAVFVKSEQVSKGAVDVRGPDFDLPLDLLSLLDSYASVGFQATGLHKAISIINEMVIASST